MNVQDLLARIVTNPSKYTITDNGLEYRLEEQDKPYSIFFARHTEFKHILNCIHTRKELLGKDITSEYIDNVSSFFRIVTSVCTYSSDYRLSKLMNNKYIQSSTYSNLSDLEKQIIITYYISIPKQVESAGEDSEGCYYNSVCYNQV